MKYPAYPAYKSSGVEWLGDVPGHWEVKRLKYAASLNDEALAEATDPEHEFEYVDISSVDPVLGITATEPMSFESAPSRARRLVKNGDTIISTVRTYLRAIAPIENSAENLVVSTGFAVVRPRSVVPEYLSYALRENGFVDTVVARSVGVSYPAVNASEIATIPIPLPFKNEQQTIANFLESQTAKLDSLIAKKQTLIGKLKEKRAALISRVVTRGLPPEAARAAGLNPHPKLKPSGIAWLGEVPEHWSYAQLRRFIAFLTSGSRGWAEHYTDEGSIFIRIGNLTRDSIALDLVDIQYVEPPEGTEGERTRVKDGDILVSITAYLGSVAVAHSLPKAAFISQHIALVRVLPSSLNSRYAAYSILADFGQSQLNSQGYGGTKVQLALDDIKSLWLPIPPDEEQTAIVEFLDHSLQFVDVVIATVGKAIDHLQEYRAALITSAVTGKIDVREVSE